MAEFHSTVQHESKLKVDVNTVCCPGDRRMAKIGKPGFPTVVVATTSMISSHNRIKVF